ncbi:MAG: hypothetical protein K8F60_12205 [Melioribacteraceae bacterium]|nr:hypothetical protein [Melioribacteraceae bacterium]
MERIVNIAKNKVEADKWEIHQQINMKPEERQKIVKLLKLRFYGKNCKDVKEVHFKNVQ